jgi:hypothetical protein
MNQPEMLDSDIRALQQWLRARELRNQMKQCSADLRERLQMVAEQQSEPLQQPLPAYSRPELRILSW